VERFTGHLPPPPTPRAPPGSALPLTPCLALHICCHSVTQHSTERHLCQPACTANQTYSQDSCPSPPPPSPLPRRTFPRRERAKAGAPQPSPPKGRSIMSSLHSPQALLAVSLWCAGRADGCLTVTGGSSRALAGRAPADNTAGQQCVAKIAALSAARDGRGPPTQPFAGKRRHGVIFLLKMEWQYSGSICSGSRISPFLASRCSKMLTTLTSSCKGQTVFRTKAMVVLCSFLTNFVHS
jgi:hypothetical protein